PKKLFRPMALLAGALRRPQIVHRSGNRLRVLVESYRVELIGAGEFRPHVPTRAGTHVTTDAAHPCVRAGFKGRKLRLHDGVTGFAAKTHRLRIFISPITAKRARRNEHESDHQKNKKSAPRARI